MDKEGRLTPPRKPERLIPSSRSVPKDKPRRKRDSERRDREYDSRQIPPEDSFEVSPRRQHTSRRPNLDNRQRPQQKSRQRQRPQQRPKTSQRPKTRRRFALPEKIKRIISIGTVAAAVVILGVLIVPAMMNPNALAVYLNENFIGYIPISGDLDSEAVHEQAVSHLESSIGTSVIVDQRVTVRPARATRNNTMRREEMNRTLASSFTYQILATAIYVNNQREGIVRTSACADEVISLFQRPLMNENTRYVEFVEPFDLRPVIVDLDTADILAPLDAVAVLDRPVNTIVPYIIQPGDSLSLIALQFGLSAERIAIDNNMTTTAIINPGNTLMIHTRKPLLSVRTVDETLTSQVIPMDVEVIPNPDLPELQRVIVQEGSDGEQQIAHRITRVDGRIVDEEILQYQIVRYPVTHIVQEGTGAPTIERR